VVEPHRPADHTRRTPLRPLLDVIDGPDDLKRLDPSQFDQLAAEIRELLITSVSRTGATSARTSSSSVPDDEPVPDGYFTVLPGRRRRQPQRLSGSGQVVLLNGLPVLCVRA